MLFSRFDMSGRIGMCPSQLKRRHPFSCIHTHVDCDGEILVFCYIF